MKAKIFKAHRKLSLFLALPVLLWSLSGLLHPFMANWMRPDIAKKFLRPTPVVATPEILSPAEALKDMSEVHQMNLITVSDQPTYRVVTPKQQLHFVNATTGEKQTDAVLEVSEALARAYLDDYESPLVSITKIEEFGPNYGYINRLLPVYRVQLDRRDGMEVVVDPRTGKLATFDTPSKRVFQKLFSWLHTWSFLGPRDSALRITLVLTVSILTLFVGFTGILSLILFKTKRADGKKRKLTPARRAHRLLGAISSLFFLMFSLSGIYHVAAKYNYDDSTQWHSAQKVQTSDLKHSPAEILSKCSQKVSSISLAVINEKPFYRLTIMDRETPNKTLYLNANDLTVLENGEVLFARELACEFSGYNQSTIKETETITNFRKDYGFIFKRLPVVRVTFNDQEFWHYTVDTANAHMAQRISPATLIEALSFINLHKFHFLDPISKDLRDYVTAIAVILISLLTIAGTALLVKKRKS